MKRRISSNLPAWKRGLIQIKHSAPLRWYRRRSQRWRTLPDCVIIGAQKCGTTSLFYYLSEHPLILRSYVKEVNYFTFHYGEGPGWYRAQFPLRLYRSLVESRWRSPALAVEASPYYLYFPDAAVRARETLPGAALIVLLRNPVDRAYSHYHHVVRRGYETSSFAEVVEREMEALRGRCSHDPAYQGEPYLGRGIYAEQLARWFALYPREAFLIIRSEDFFASVEDVLHQVYAFAGLPPLRRKRIRQDRKKHLAYGYPPLEESTRSSLSAFFSSHNQRLYHLLNRDFGW